ncbi:MAG: DUF3325 domain-containing protein [Vicinamibacteraceae bacterium]
MLIVLAASLAYAGVTGLCLSMPRHHLQVWRRHPTGAVRVILRVAGWLCLIGALVASAAAWGWPIGSVAWVGFLSVSALALVFLLAYVPRVAAVLALLILLLPLLLLAW